MIIKPEKVQELESLCVVSDLDMNDAGNYSCVAQNMYGSEEITYFLEVKCNYKVHLNKS